MISQLHGELQKNSKLKKWFDLGDPLNLDEPIIVKKDLDLAIHLKYKYFPSKKKRRF